MDSLNSILYSGAGKIRLFAKNLLTSVNLMKYIGLLDMAIAHALLFSYVIVGLAYFIVHVQVVLAASLVISHVSEVVIMRGSLHAFVDITH